jgi:hypothetical protein
MYEVNALFVYVYCVPLLVNQFVVEKFVLLESITFALPDCVIEANVGDVLSS